MRFITDNQTLEDLKILGRGDNSVMSIFNRTVTRGGAELLDELFRYPLSDANAINHRSGIIQYFASIKAVFPFSGELFDVLEQYLSHTDERTRLSPDEHTLGKKLTHLIAEDTEYKNIYKGVTAVIDILHGFRSFIDSIGQADEFPYRAEKNAIAELLSDPALALLVKEQSNKKIPYNKVAAYDTLIRFRHRDTIKRILGPIYHLDVYISVAKVALQRGFVFPRALPKEQHTLQLEGVYHPQLKDPVPNTLHMTPDSNLVFLTGANMAGKSTFMKSLGIALFLAHMGFPVPARKMEFSVFDGIYTTINLPDNLGLGASHFYAEVLRVKKLAKELSLSKDLFIIFDELFRGTNVKDAYEATIAITGAFAQRRNSMFVISTHIMEAGEVLRQQFGNISFQYLPTKMNGNDPVYTYTLEAGITDDRHGMVIIRNEGIIDILKNGKKKIS
ncbi:MAG TPA: DNA mismatch repair protein [Puia sp.]